MITRKTYVSIITVIEILIIIGLIIWSQNRGMLIGFFNNTPKEGVIPENDWKVLSAINADDTANVINVCYDQKYGNTVNLYCLVVFQNDKIGQIKFVAPWIDNAIVERSNMNDIKIKVVSKKGVPIKEISR